MIGFSFGKALDQILVDAKIVDPPPLVSVAGAEDEDFDRKGAAHGAGTALPGAIVERPKVALTQIGHAACAGQFVQGRA